MGLVKVRGTYRYLKFNISKHRGKMLAAMGVDALEHFLKGFENGGGQTDASRGGWKPRLGNRDSGRAILVKSANLKNSLQVARGGRSSIRIVTKGIPYAARHNEGLGRMPKREFVGDSQELFKALEKQIDKIILPNL